VLRLQLYILRRLAASLALVVLAVGGVLFIGQTVKFLDRMPEVGLEFLLAVLPMFLPMTFALTIPLAFLVSVVMTYGRLADDNEVLAMRMAGVHPWAVAAPGVFAGAILCFACLELEGELSPAAIAGQDSLRGDVYRRFMELIERGERNRFTVNDFKISWTEFREGRLGDLHISKGDSGSPDFQEVHAARGSLSRDASGRVLVFTLEDFLLVHSGAGKRLTERGARKVFSIAASDLLAVQGTIAKPRALTYRQLLFRAFRLPPGAEARNDMLTEVFGRIARSLAPLVFALCGVPLALLVGRGSRSAAAVLAFAVAVAYFVVWEFCDSLAGSGRVAPWTAFLGGTAAMAGAGLALLAAVVRR
jgi:lipopolysaccharide export system permease protein